jgi:predicted phosphate transport protein (TIGR00153 family)
MSKLLSSLKKTSTSKTIKAAKEHVLKASECIMTLRAAFQKFNEGVAFDEVLKKLNIVSDLEHQADQIRRSIILEVSSSEIEDKTREALMHLVKNVDNIANQTNATARIFVHVPQEYFEMLMKEGEILKMLDTTVEASKILINMIDELMSGGKRFDDLNQKIQTLEHDVDNGLSNMYGRLVTMDFTSQPLQPFVAIQISAGLNFLEGITDAIEDTADYIKLLTIRKE